jgi:hypothetical protein
VIRIERVTLPPGLRAVARRDENGHLVVYVSAELSSRQQRAAVLEAVRASRRAGWRAALPIWIGLAAGLRFWLRRLQSAIRTQPAAWGTGAGAIVVGALVAGLLLGVPGAHSPLAQGGTPGATPTGQGSGSAGGHGHGRNHVRPISVVPSGSAPGQPKPGSSSPGPGSSSPAPGHSHSASSSPPPGHSSSPSPHPSQSSSSPSVPPSSSSPAPTRSSKPTTSKTPAPSPKPSKSKHCIIILGIKVCISL